MTICDDFRIDASARRAAETGGASGERAQLLERVHQSSFALMWQMKCDMDETFRTLALKPFEVLTLELLTQGLRYPKDLADALDVAPPVVSALLRGLEERGLVERRLDPSDHRRVSLSLTRAGRSMHARARRTWRELQHRKLARLSLDQLRSLEHIQHALLEEQ